MNPKIEIPEDFKTNIVSDVGGLNFITTSSVSGLKLYMCLKCKSVLCEGCNKNNNCFTCKEQQRNKDLASSNIKLKKQVKKLKRVIRKREPVEKVEKAKKAKETVEETWARIRAVKKIV